MKYLLRYLLVLALSPAWIWAQTKPRPVPYPVIYAPQFEKALANGTRSLDGKPGAKYWQNSASYLIETALDPAKKLLTGEVRIQYKNNSPDELKMLYVHLRQNIYKPTAARNRAVPNPTDGMNVSEVSILTSPAGAEEKWQSAQQRVQGTLMSVLPPAGIKPNQDVTLKIKWSFTVPEKMFRMGHDGEMFMIAYWYPQISVYDDVRGWDTDQYMGNGEFYMNFADYDVKITLPQGFILTATGELQNPNEVLTETSLSRLAEAMKQDQVVQVVKADERGKATRTSDSGLLTWHFKAKNVRDFSFATSDKYLWDATRAEVGDLSGDGKPDFSAIHAFYRPEAQHWNQAAKFGRFSIEHMSKRIFPYPWSHMSVIEGFIGGGMEFPMLTHIGRMRNEQSLFGVTYHELAHMWFPLMIGNDEKAFTWMEEGMTSFNDTDGTNAYYPAANAWNPAQNSYLNMIKNGMSEVECMRHKDQMPNSAAQNIAAYDKPATLFHALRGAVGQEKFMQALRQYAKDWGFKHPYPYDFFNAFENSLGMDLDWFWTAGFFQTWTHDLAVKEVKTTGKKTQISIEDLSYFPMPVTVEITTDGKTERRTIPVSDWLSGKRVITLEVAKGTVQKVVIDPDLTNPDMNRDNNTWNKP